MASSISNTDRNASRVRQLDAKFAADNLKYSRDFISKVHFVAIVKLDFGKDGIVDFKYRSECEQGSPTGCEIRGRQFEIQPGFFFQGSFRCDCETRFREGWHRRFQIRSLSKRGPERIQADDGQFAGPRLDN